MFRLSVKSEMKAALRDMGLKAGQVDKVARRSLNKVAMRARTVARRETAKAMGLKQSAIKKSISIQRAGRDLEAGVKGSGRPISLVNFKARQTKKGVTASAWGQRKLYPGTFLAPAKGAKTAGAMQVFKRKYRNIDPDARLPILKLWGPAVPREMANEIVVRAMDEKVRDDLPKIVRQESAFVMRTNR